MITNFQRKVIQKVFNKLKKKRKFELGLCRFAYNMHKRKEISLREYNSFNIAIYKNRKDKHYYGLYFFEPGLKEPRVKFLEELLCQKTKI